MRVRISYAVEVSDLMRRAIRGHYGQEGMATRQEIKNWYTLNGVCASGKAEHDQNKLEAETSGDGE